MSKRRIAALPTAAALTHWLGELTFAVESQALSPTLQELGELRYDDRVHFETQWGQLPWLDHKRKSYCRRPGRDPHHGQRNQVFLKAYGNLDL